MVVDVEISLAVQVLEEALIHEAKSKSKSLRGVEEKFKLLKDYLWATQNFLENANYKRQLEDERVRGWISEVREVANEAEDKVEMFLVKAERRRRRRRRLFKSIITKLSALHKRQLFKSIITKRDEIGDDIDSIWDRLSALHKRELFKSIITKRDEIGDDIDSIWDRLSALHKRHNISNLRPAPLTKGIITEAQLRLPSRDEHVVGMEDEVEKVLRGSLILDEKKKGVSVAVVEGMAGIGKTTLAWEIYNHPDVVARFEWRGWVTVSSEFTLERTMKQLILQLPASHSQKLRELELEESTKAKPYVQQKFQEMLRKHLQGKTYFIVLDDVWEKEHWESLKPAFPDEQDKASRLLVTTRNKYIATDDQYTHGMKLLDPEKSWELLLMKTRFDECPEKFEHTGREIVERCEGLPLAISEVGGLLAATRTKREWEQVLNQISSHLERAGVFKSWELSYRNLSPWLKSCFLCLAFFKGDATIPAKTLMHIWVGQGLIQQDHTATARGYLEELIDRNMLQIVDLNIEGRVKNCYLHGILREVCLRRANEELGLEMKTGEDGISIPLHQSRHRVLNGGNLEILSLCRGKHLRSLFLRNNEGVGVGVGVDVEYVISLLPHDFGKSCKLLKTLSLDGFTLSRFPDFLGSLIRLKYLRIRRHKIHSKYVEHQLEPMKLPNWLDGLEHLEIVDMEGEKVEFPNDVTLEMKRLRYFRAYCVRGPISIDSWGNIETLKYMRLDDWMSCCRTLNSICGVRELGLFLDLLNTPREWSNVRASLLLRTPMLEYLQLRWNPIIPIDPQIVSHLPTHLTKLKLRGKLTKCPPPTMFPQNLTHLTLAFSGLHQDLMPQLSELPKLSHLKLSGNAYKPEKMQVLHHGFPCLKALSLKEMFRLKSIHIDKCGMPCLQQLRIQQCPSLQTMNLPQHVVIKRVT